MVISSLASALHSGRLHLKKEFAASHPYFDFSDCGKVEKQQKKAQVDTWIKSQMPEKARSNDKVFLLFKNCISSLEFHRSFLEEHLHRQSNARASVFMLEKAPHTDHVTVKYE